MPGGDKTPPDRKNEEQLIQVESVSQFPEGGLAGWTTVLGSFLVQFCGFGYSTSFGVYQNFYVRQYLTNESPSTISINTFLVISGGLVAGRLYDRGYFYPMLYSGSLLISFSLFMLSLAKPDHFYQIFLSQGLGAGLGTGIIYVPSVAIVSHYFQRRRALAMTIVASGSSFGAVIHPVMLNNMLNNRRFSFGTAIRASAGLVSGLLLVACVLMRTRLPPPQKSAHLGKALVKFSRDRAYVAATLGLMIFMIGFYFPLFYLQLDAASHGLSKTFSFYSLVIMNFSSFIGRLASGLVAHKFGVPNMIVGATFCCAVLILGMIGLGSLASVVVIGVIYGFFSGTYVALLPPLMAVLTDDLSELGARMGIAFTFSAVSSLVSTPIDGALLTSRFIWWRPALFSGIMAFTGFTSFGAMLIILRRREARKAGGHTEEKA
ncbi:Riboflavin transporter MCH5 [Grifola frondosa]|uniref:Riboflavin transporter MCH5 n=1 Tax=Grifola frondosa TaxID=5627 RepID=A0A1C7LMU8_GRIFR|nr:Riboflavin transporter MCH5 [Grifola frondosa]